MKTTFTYAALWVAACLALNGFIFAMGWNDNTGLPLRPAWAPPGWVIGAIWVVLFATMGAAHGRLAQAKSGAAPWIVTLLLACLAYPLYTAGLQNGVVGWWGNLFTLGLALNALWQTRTDTRNNSRTSWLLLPVVLWLAFALCLTTATLQLNA